MSGQRSEKRLEPEIVNIVVVVLKLNSNRLQNTNPRQVAKTQNYNKKYIFKTKQSVDKMDSKSANLLGRFNTREKNY